ncbi:hypothetical protein BGW80DRAFT_1174421, partial [Lactifluus volemus]
LPVEILERIVQEVLLSQSYAFSSISALSMVSHQFRFIALRAFFSRLTVHRLSKASRIGNIPNSYSWVRHLSTTMQIVEKKVLPVHKMKLGSLELSCESVSTFSLAASILLVFPHLPKSLVSLRITSLPHITQLLLREIARWCTNVKELELSVVERLSTDCCWTCFESRVRPSRTPPNETHSLLHRLKAFYARSLQPLKSLQRLSIGVFLSSSAVLKDHIDNHSLEGEHWGASISIPERSIIIGYRPYAPTRCALCWEAHGHRTREDELLATMRLAQNLRSLELVRWNSWFINSPTATPNLSAVNDRGQTGGPR